MPTNGRIAGIFQVGTYEEPQFVIAEWFPDPEQIEVEMIAMANAFDNWTAPLMEARAAMIEDTRLHFETEHDPYGDKWQSLNEDYRHTKVELGGFPDHILVRTGALEKAATGEEAWFVDERSIFFNTAALPPYGPIHQEGTEEGTGATSLKNVLNKAARISAGSGESFAQHEVATLHKGGRGLNLPQRMFIGADLPTIDEIEAIFVRHLDNTVTKHWGGEPITPLGFGSNVLGTFPVISFTASGQPLLRTPRGPRFGRFIRL